MISRMGGGGVYKNVRKCEERGGVSHGKVISHLLAYYSVLEIDRKLRFF